MLIRRSIVGLRTKLNFVDSTVSNRWSIATKSSLLKEMLVRYADAQIVIGVGVLTIHGTSITIRKNRERTEVSCVLSAIPLLAGLRNSFQRFKRISHGTEALETVPCK